MKKRWAALALCVCLLAGCAGQSAVSTAETAQTATGPTAAPQTLTVCSIWPDTAAVRALEQYAETQGVTLQNSDTYEEADLVILPSMPDNNGSWQNLADDTLLSAAAERTGLDVSNAVTALPLGKSLYGYWADARALTALLQSEDALGDLRAATWQEWSDFVTAVTAWVAEPAETTVTLNGRAYTLPAERPEALAALNGVFAIPENGGDSSLENIPALYTPALLAAGETRSADTLTGPLNGLNSALALEYTNQAQGVDGVTADSFDCGDLLAGGQALFCRAFLADLAGGHSAALTDDRRESLVWLPIKTELADEDISNGSYVLKSLMEYPVYAVTAYLAIPAAADAAGVKAAKAALLWLYNSAEGENTLIGALTLVTPWDTADGDSALGAMQIEQVGKGILPGQGAVNGASMTETQASALWGAQYGFGGLYRDETGTPRETWDTAAGDVWRDAAAAALSG